MKKMLALCIAMLWLPSIVHTQSVHASYDLNGIWTSSRGSIVSIAQHAEKIEGVGVAPGPEAKKLGFASGDRVLYGLIQDDKFIGKIRQRFSLEFKALCPEQWDHWSDIELNIVDGHTLTGRLLKRTINNDCRTTDTSWEPYQLVRKKFGITEDAKQINISLNSDILFDFNHHDLRQESLNVLSDIKSLIIDKQSYTKILIEGHTDDIGLEAYNLALSRKRAQSVADWMIQHNVVRSQLAVKGYGKNKPKFANATDSERAKNRRVEITILR